MNIVSSIGIIAALMLLVGGIFWIAARLAAHKGWRRLGTSIAAIGCLYFAYVSVLNLLECTGKPLAVPRADDVQGVSSFIDSCENDLGWIVRAIGYVLGPAGSLVLGLVAWRTWKTRPVRF